MSTPIRPAAALETAEQVRLLRKLSTDIGATLDLEEIFEIVLNMMTDEFGFEHSMILLLDQGHGQLRVVASCGYSESGVGATVDIGTGVIGVVAKRKRIMRVGNLGQARMYSAAVRKEFERVGETEKLGEVVKLPGLSDVEAQIAIPMLMKDELIGVFAVESNKLGAFEETDENLVSLVANQAASAINNARLYKDAEEQRQELAKAHAELLRWSEELEKRVDERTRELRETQAQLVQSGKMAALGELVAGVAHEINNPIGSVTSAQKTLVRGLERLKENVNPDGEKVLRIVSNATRAIGEGSDRVAEIVRRLRSFARLDQAEVQRIDLHECLEDAIALITADELDGVVIERDFSELPKITCSPGRLNQVFFNVLKNARQASRKDGVITVRTSMRGADLVVSISDTGEGISPERLPRIFDPGFTTRGVGVGTGLGLAIAYQIVQDHHGTITAESEPGSGTTIEIALPKSGLG